MLYQMIVAVLLVVFAANLILNLRALRRPDSNSKIAEPAPLSFGTYSCQERRRKYRNLLKVIAETGLPQL